MKKFNKKIALGIMSAVLLGSIGVTTLTTAVQAEETSTRPFVQALAERLGLGESEVEEALEEIKAEHFAEKQQAREDKLNQAVEDGILTQEQADALQEKHQEMWQERKQDREQHREEMDAWFEEQGIDHEALHEYMGGPKGFGKRMYRMSR